MTDYAAMSDRALLRAITRNADRLDTTDSLYEERLALIRAARDDGARTPIGYREIAEAARLSEAALFKITRVARRREAANGNGKSA